MGNKKRGTKTRVGFTITLLPVLMISTILYAEDVVKRARKHSQSQGDYTLMVKENFISLKAKKASLREILEEIGERMDIEVVANIPWEETITVELDMMYLGDAIKRFRANYACVTESEEEKGKVTKIVVVPTGLGKSVFLPPKKSLVEQEERKKIRYNPQPSLQTYETTEEKEIEEPESVAREDVEPEAPSQSETLELDNNSQPSAQDEQ